MTVLVLGGTQFVGRHMVESLLAGGHRVSVLNRGRTADELPAGVERLRGDRDAGPAGLTHVLGRLWDVCIDVSGYTPAQVRPSAESLRDIIGRYIFISAVRVYGDPVDRPVRETHPLEPPADESVTEISQSTYGPLKVACENIVRGVYAGRCTVLRPQIVVGPHEPGSRFGYWVRRASEGGETMVPGDGNDYLQVIDARDVAAFTRRVVEHAIPGTFNLSGQRLTWAEFVSMLGIERPVWVPAGVIKSAGVTEFELPLFRPEHGRSASLMHVCNAAAVFAGLKITTLPATLADTRAWLAGRDVPLALTPERETVLIRRSRDDIQQSTDGSVPG